MYMCKQRFALSVEGNSYWKLLGTKEKGDRASCEQGREKGIGRRWF